MTRIKRSFGEKELKEICDWYHADPSRMQKDAQEHFGVSNTVVRRAINMFGGKMNHAHRTRSDMCNRISITDPYLYLALSIIKQAKDDLDGGSTSAKDFFRSDWFKFLAGAIEDIMDYDLSLLMEMVS